MKFYILASSASILLGAVPGVFSSEEYKLRGSTSAVAKSIESFADVLHATSASIVGESHDKVDKESAVSNGDDITENECIDLFKRWNKALTENDPEAVANFYAHNSTLLPTLKTGPLIHVDHKVKYFEHFMAKEPQLKLVESYVNVGNKWCMNVGLYNLTFGFDDPKPPETGNPLRYSFGYNKMDDGEWKIIHHHSSLDPCSSGQAECH